MHDMLFDIQIVFFFILFQNSIPFTASLSLKPLNLETKNLNFDKWVQDAPHEILTPVKLAVQGTIPSYVRGSLIRNGAGQWGTKTERYAHVFDGLAKLSKYEIKDGNVTFSTQFIESKWRNEAVKNGRLLPGLTTGPRLNAELTERLETPLISALFNSISFDNVPVNVWDYQRREGRHIYAITDAPTRAQIDPMTLKTLVTAKPPKWARDGNGYEMLSTAHPEYCKSGSGSTYNAIIELNPLMGNRVSLVKEDQNGERTIVSSCIISNGIPYIHSFGLTENKAMIVLQPLRLGLNDLSKMVQDGFMATMQHSEHTVVIVMDLHTGNVLAQTKIEEPIYFYHAISCIERTLDQEKTLTDHRATELSFRLCGYKEPDIITGHDMFLRLDRANTAEGRNRISRGGKLCEVKMVLYEAIEGDTLQKKTQPQPEPRVQVKWTDVCVRNTIDGTCTMQGFELPTHRYSRWSNGKYDRSITNHRPPWKLGTHPQYVYAYGAYANGSDSYDEWNLLKIDTTSGDAISLRERDSCYYSEPIFVSDPDGTMDDDGVLLCQRYDGRSDVSSLLVICAKCMTVLAEACTGVRNPMDYHGMFLPEY